MIRVLFFVFLLLQNYLALAKDVVNYSWYKLGREHLSYDHYYQDLLKLALKKSVEKFGPYELAPIDAGMSQQHMFELAGKDQLVNLVWTMTSKDRESRLIPIRIPLLKGLGGCRIALIRKGNQPKFQALSTKSELSQLQAGQGKLWPDTQILKTNGFQVTTAQEHNSLIPMLVKDRFDYFPRALHEAFNEAAQYPSVEVEQRFLIFYDAPFFFFVNKQNPRIAQRIEYGLTKAIKDGSFDNYFNNHPVTKDIIEKANIHSREVLRLSNPLLTSETRAALQKLNHQSTCINKPQN